jgi:release factor glutamine methyltransferase
MQVHQLRTSAAATLAGAGIEQAELEAELLLRHCLGCSRSGLFLRLDETLDPRDEEAVNRLVARRCTREPLQYITGSCEFRSLEFTVTPAVLIPRPETEILVDLALAGLARDNNPHPLVLDLCTGSGCIGASLALELPGARVIGCDLSPGALAVARGNLRRHGLEERVLLLCGDLMTAFDQGLRFDAIVTNPPYVVSSDLAGLQPEVRDFEPRQALDGGEDGLDCIRKIRDQARCFLRPGGRLFMEIGSDIEAGVLQTFRKCGAFSELQVHPDLAGLPRVLQARLIKTNSAS